jgi:NAD(P)-dependent dehydrogenase (short-subunit alcohol dehydrogenase family)
MRDVRESDLGLHPLLKLAAAGAAGWLAYRLLWPPSYSLRDRAVLVTGGSRGLGLVLARELARHGARVAISARDDEELGRAVEDLAARGADVLAVTADVRDPAQAAEAVREVVERWGRIDVLVNNAGTITVGPLETMTLADFEAALRVNFWGPLHMTLAALPHMRRQGEGRIVNVSSIGGKVAVPHLLPYTASKFALTGLSEGLRAELAKDNVTVVTVCPGLMRTGSPRNATFKGRHEEEYAWFAVSDALPLLSMSAERAARQIIDALRRGSGEVVLSLPAKALVFFHDLCPGLTADVLALVNRLVLPPPGGIGTGYALGKESESAAAPSLLTALGDRAAARNNEIDPAEPAASRSEP